MAIVSLPDAVPAPHAPYPATPAPPVLDPIGDRSVAEAQTLEFTLGASDADGDNIVFSAYNLPPGAKFDAATHTFSWTPGYNQAGVYADLEFTIVDDGDPIGVDAELITITVGNVNRPPLIVPVGALSVNEFEPVLFAVMAADPDGDPVAFSAGPLPEGASFDTASGQFTWTPNGSQVGNYTLAFFALDGGGAPVDIPVLVSTRFCGRSRTAGSSGSSHTSVTSSK